MRLISATIEVNVIETVEEPLAFKFFADEEEGVVYGRWFDSPWKISLTVVIDSYGLSTIDQ